MSRRRGRRTVLRGLLVLIGLALGMVLSACAEPSDPPIRPIRPIEPPNTAGLSTPDPDGPLYLDPKDARNDVERRTGAAGRMVQCTTEVEGGFMPGRYEIGRPGPPPRPV